MNEPKTWIWGVLIGGVAMIALSLSFGLFDKNPPMSPSASLARAEKLTGSAFLVKRGGLQRQPLEGPQSVSHLESVETGDLGEVRLDFESSDRIRLKENSLAMLEKVEDQSGFHVVLVLKRGDLQIESVGREGDLFISKNGERLSALDYQSSSLARAPVVESANETATPPADAAGSLSESEIQAVMNSHRTSFLKCYTQILQKDPTAKGEVSLSFTIENTGQISAVDVGSATLRQKDFNKCLIDIMNRIEFRSFKGSPVSTLFPLRFE